MKRIKRFDKFSKDVLFDMYIQQNKTGQEVGDLLGYHRREIEDALRFFGIQKSMDLRKQVMLRLYGVENASQSEAIKSKKCITCNLHHGVTNPGQSPEVQKKMRDTTRKHYGVDNASQSVEVHRRKLETNIKNNTGRTSPAELQIFNWVKEKYEVIHQYLDYDRYPYICDFYLPDYDLFIEYNAHWSHGSKPYNPTYPECLEYAKYLQQYLKSFYTYTVRDPEKRNLAKEKSLRFIELWGKDFTLGKSHILTTIQNILETYET